MSTRTTRLDLRYEQQKCHNIIVAPSRTAILFSGVLLLGVFIGYTMGSRAVRDEVRRKQLREKR